MFDDPKKDLRWLEEQLLAAEEEQWVQPEQAPEEEALPESGGLFLREEPEQPLPPEPEEEEPSPGRQSSRVPILAAALLLEIAVLLGVLAWWLLWR